MKKGTSAKLVAAGLLALAGLSASASAWTQEDHRPWYVGGAVGTAHARSLCDAKGSLSCGQNAGTWSLFAGYRFSEFLAVEGGRTRPGTYKMSGTVGGAPSNADLEMKLWDVVAVGSYPIVRDLRAYGKAGLYFGSTSFTGRIGAAPFGGENHSRNLTVALGAELDTSPIAVRLEWQRFHHVEAGSSGGGSTGIAVQPGDIDNWSIGLLYKF